MKDLGSQADGRRRADGVRSGSRGRGAVLAAAIRADHNQSIPKNTVLTRVTRQTYRQFRGLELIASENLTSLAVMEANGSFFTNKYVTTTTLL